MAYVRRASPGGDGEREFRLGDTADRPQAGAVELGGGGHHGCTTAENSKSRAMTILPGDRDWLVNPERIWSVRMRR